MSEDTITISPAKVYYRDQEQRHVTIGVIVDSCGDQELNVMSALEQVMKYATGGSGGMDRLITLDQERRIATWFGARYGRKL